jgi:hypothetical protein
MKEWLGRSGFEGARWTRLPADPEAKGPNLFSASARRS